MKNNPFAIIESDFDALPKGTVNLFKKKKYDECLAICEEVLITCPNNTGALMYKGNILQNREEFDKAAICYHLIVDICPKFFPALFYEGECLMCMGKFEEAMDCFKETLSLNSRHTLSWCFSALCFAMLGKEGIGLQLLDMAYDEADNKSQVLLCKGILEEHSGKKDDALISYMNSQMLTKDEKEESAKRIYKLLHEGM